MPLDLFDRLQRILPLADKVIDEIVCEETEILEKIIPRMFEMMQKVAIFSCDYVKRGRFGRQSSCCDLVGADERSGNGGWASPPTDDRRNR